MVSLYDIAFYFVETMVNKKLYNGSTKELFTKATATFADMLDNNMTSEQLMKEISNLNKPITESTNLYSLFSRPDASKENLLKSGTFYYHNLLRCIPAPPQTSWDINTGEIITINEPHFLEMRASITLDEITEYYCKRFEINQLNISINRYKGSIKYMIDKLGIDIVLFMIDTASDIIKADDLQRPTSPVAVGEYEVAARESYFAKVSENKASGDDQIVFKPRILPCGNGWKETQQEFSEEYFNYA